MSVLSTLPTFERGQVVPDLDLLGRLHAADALLDERRAARPGRRAPGCGWTTATTRSPHFSSGSPMTAQSCDGGVRHQRLLDLGRVHVEAAGDDHVLGPVDDEQEVVVVEVADVAGVVPAVAPRPRPWPPGCGSSRPSPASCAPRSRRARRRAAARRRVHDRDRHQGRRTTGRGRAARVATRPVREEVVGRRPSSRSSSAPRSGRTAGPSPARCGSAPPPAGSPTSAPRRTRSTAATRGPSCRGVGVAEHHVDQRRRQEGVRHPVPLDELEEAGHVGRAHDHDLAAEGQHREAQHAGGVGQRREREVDRAPLERVAIRVSAVIVSRLVPVSITPFGPAGRAAGADDHGDVVDGLRRRPPASADQEVRPARSRRRPGRRGTPARQLRAARRGSVAPGARRTPGRSAPCSRKGRAARGSRPPRCAG